MFFVGDDVFECEVIVVFPFSFSCLVNGFPGHHKITFNFNFAAGHHGMLNGIRHGGFFPKQLSLEVECEVHGLSLPFVVPLLKAAISVLAFFDQVQFVLDDVFVDRPLIGKRVAVVLEDHVIKNERFLLLIVGASNRDAERTSFDNASCIIVCDFNRKFVDKPTMAKLIKNKRHNNELKIVVEYPRENELSIN